MNSQSMRWTGWALTGLFVAFMLFDVAIKWLDLPIVDDTMLQLGYARGYGFWIGVLETVLLVLYVVPRTSVLGAVLFMGVFGGAPLRATCASAIRYSVTICSASTLALSCGEGCGCAIRRCERCFRCGVRKPQRNRSPD